MKHTSGHFLPDHGRNEYIRGVRVAQVWLYMETASCSHEQIEKSAKLLKII